METSFDANTFIPNAFDYNFDTALGSNEPITGVPHSSNSASPPAQLGSRISNGSGDSGLMLDLEGEGVNGDDRRSNSVDKDILTPAQSRRKAQNRAA